MQRESYFASPVERAKKWLDWLFSHRDADIIPDDEYKSAVAQWRELISEMTEAEKQEVGDYHDELEARKWGGSHSKH